jgi:hypothetical protein
MQIPTRFLPAVLCATIVAAPATAQQAKDIMNTAVEKYEQRMKGIENYTVVQDILGTAITTYFERSTVDGRTVFVPSRSSIGGGGSSAGTVDPYREMSRIVDRAKYEGRKDIDGLAVHAIRIDDPQDLDFGQSIARSQQGADFTIDNMMMYLDTKDYVIRRVEMAGTMARDGKSNPITMTMDFTDYRSVEGMLHPFRTTLRMEGIAEAANISDKDLEKARASLDKLEADMAKMSDSQRQMMQRVMGGQLEKLRALVQSGGTEMQMEVTELHVNAGPPTK